LGSTRFEELQLMKFSWRNNIPDLAAWNSEQTEEVNMDEYQEFLMVDECADECGSRLGEDEVVSEGWN